mgnify:FL=1
MNNNIEEIFKKVKDMCGNSSDIVTRLITKKNYRIGYIYLESVSSDDKISNFLNKAILNIDKKRIFDSLFINVKNNIFNSNIKFCNDYDELFFYLASGYTALVLDNTDKYIVIETKASIDRGIQEASSEPIIRGPKDSFTENHSKNLGLIRKRIKDPNLYFNDVIVGVRTKTKVTVGYISDIANKNNVDKIISKLNNISIDGIFDSGYIRELLEGKEKSLFPKVLSTERPDLACTSLLNGKIIILVENSPFILILPAILDDFIHSPDDNYQKPFNASFSRILRFICFFLALVTPAIYIALMTFNHEIIPNQLLISLAIKRDGIPFPTAIEVLIFVLTFELLRQADIHAPSFSGSAMNIVGALILGDAAVAADIVSPIVIIIVATTSICELVFYDQDIIDALREWRIIFILASTILGIIGVVIAFIMFISKLCSLKCLNAYYLTPFSPLNINMLKDSIVRFNRKKLKKRPSIFTKNLKRMDDVNEKNTN